MANTTKIFDMAALAEAAYASFANEGGVLTISNQDDLVARLQDFDANTDNGKSGFSKTQAEEFATHYRVVSQRPNTASGYSGTLFERLDDSGAGTGEYIFAQRGTEPTAQFGLDMAVDLDDLVPDGLAWTQIVDMYNYWKELTTPAGQTYQKASLVQSALPPTSGGFIIDNSLIGSSTKYWQIQLSDASSPTGAKVPAAAALEVTGHSLGGHLASAFTRLFDGVASQTYTLNGAGYSILGAGNNDYVFSVLGGAASFTSTAVQNLRGSEGPDIVTQDFALKQVGASDQIFIEQGGLFTDNPLLSAAAVFGHSATQLTDSAAIYDLFIRLDADAATRSPSQYLPKLLGIFEAGSNAKATSLEEVVRALARTFGVDDSPIATNDREALHARIKLIRDDVDFQSMEGLLQIRPQSFDVKAAARNDFGALVALMDLSPFSITGNDAASNTLVESMWSSMRADDYAAWQADKSATVPTTFTDQWITDRSAMLAWVLKANSADNTDLVLKSSDEQYFLDYNDAGGVNKVIRTGSSSTGDDSRRHFVFGGGADDSLNGASKNDHLYGGAGNDTLNGKAGDDYLEGGSGADTYQFSDTYGRDTILDADGLGGIQIGSDTLNGGKQIDENMWLSSDGKYLYTLDGTTLSINQRDDASAGSITVKNYTAGQLGLSLEGAKVPTVTSSILNGDFGKLELNGVFSRDGVNYASDGNSVPGAADLITGGAAADTINGLGGNDILRGMDGDDTINGGDGNDILMGGLGADTINGGDGIDTIYGSSTGTLSYPGSLAAADNSANGNRVAGDWAGFGWSQYVNTDQSLWSYWGRTMVSGSVSWDTQAGDAGNTIDAGAGNDEVFAGTGNDVVHGGADDDNIYGMAGSDVLMGDAGDDKIAGDGGEDTGWVHYTAPQDQGNDVIDGGAGNDELWGQGGDDVVFGGTGNDLIIGDDTDLQRTPLSRHGNDYLSGGEGDDKVLGQGGNDYLSGGDGNDILEGDDDDVTRTPTSAHGSDLLDGGAGNDTMTGGGKGDSLYGGDGNDTMWGDDDLANLAADQHGSDYMEGGAGNDQMVGGERDDILLGGTGDDVLMGDGSSSAVENALDGADLLDGGDGDDKLFGQGGDDTLRGGAGNDQLSGGAGSDWLEGGSGTDTMQGGAGADTLVSSGADYLAGGAGDDVYRLAQDGVASTLVDTQGTNVLADASSSNVRVFREGGSVYVAVGSGIAKLNSDAELDSLYISDASGASISLRTHLQNTSDGRVEVGHWSGSGVVDSSVQVGSQWVQGSGGDDILQGGLGDDLLQGNAGSDVLKGEAGKDDMDGGAGADILLGGAGADHLSGAEDSDVLNGGAGNDLLQGGLDAAQDVYVFALGDGLDTIDNVVASTAGRDTLRFGAGIDSSSLSVSRTDGGILSIKYGNTGDAIVFTYGSENSISTLEFADGSTLSLAQVLSMLPTVTSPLQIKTHGVTTIGTSGNDTIVGNALDQRLEGSWGNDVLVGGAGDDVLVGGWGQDTFRFDANSGNDVIIDGEYWNGTDGAKLIFEGVNAATMRTRIDGNDLLIYTSSSSVRLQGYLWQGERVAGATIQIGADAAQNLTDFVANHLDTTVLTLDQRKQAFDARQLAELRSLATRNPSYSGSTVEVAAESVNQVNVQLQEGVETQLGHYLQENDIAVDETWVHHVDPIYEYTSTTYGGSTWTSKFVSLAQAGTLYPDGEFPAGTTFALSSEGSVIGIYVSTSTSTSTSTATNRIVGWREWDTLASREIFTSDIATKTTVNGTDGDDVVTSSMQSDGVSPAMFRGTIATGAGDDVIALASDDEWVGSDLAWNLPWYANPAEVRHHEHGVGAWIDAGSGDDVVHGTDGRDTIIGGTGNDLLDGQAGGDTYLISARTGEMDHIADHAALDWTAFSEGFLEYGGVLAAPNLDVVEFDSSVELTALSYRWRMPAEGDLYATLELLNRGEVFLEIDYDAASTAGQIAPTLTEEQFNYLVNWTYQEQLVIDREVSMPGVERFTFSNGITLSVQELLATIPVATDSVVPQAPTLLQALPDASLQEDSLGSTAALTTLFQDPQGQALQFSARLANGDALPEWLSVDALTGALSGTPGNAQVGVLQVALTASNTSGLATTAVFSLTVQNTNDAPLVAQALVDQAATEDTAFSYTVPADTFSDVDTGDTLSYSATLLDGSPLPSWLTFDNATRTFSGTPGHADVGTLGFVVIATDTAGASVSTSVSLSVTATPTNDPLAGNDTLYADTNNTPVLGGAGNDTLYGSWNSSTLIGGTGHDTLIAQGGPNNVLDGGAGDDTLTGSWGQDTLIGGEGNNTITALGGDSLISAGAGNDTITSNWGSDTITAGDGNNLINAGGGNNTITTGNGNDVITTDWGNDTVYAGAGNDTISTGWGADTIDAGAGDDAIRAGGGNDTVRAGLGNDTIIADQWSNDTYYFAAGDGQDSIADAGGQDQLVLENISSSQLWFSHTGNDLSINVIGTVDSILLKDWYSGYQYPGSQYHVEQFKTSDGKVLLDSQVQNLVDAMAAFAPPAAGQTTLAGSMATVLVPVLATNWQ